MITPIREFLGKESAGGILLMLASILALVFANTRLSGLYDGLLTIPLEIRAGSLEIAKPLLLWINDGLMAVFFFLVGLELKREFIEGELSEVRQIILPALGALGGMVVPASIYLAINWDDPAAISGWAIPAATDIAFALGILALLGDRVPTQLKVFLVSLAIFDDMGAIIIIALFYTGGLSLTALGVAGTCLAVLTLLNWRGSTRLSLYIIVGLVMWTAVLKSGVHATLAGVLLAFFIPIKEDAQTGRSPLRELEQDLHGSVAFIILPLFAFANAGIPLQGFTLTALTAPVPLGIELGLFVGKQIGVFGLCWLGIRLGIASLPKNVDLKQLYGVAIICGVGFTMSMFIGSLAFEDANSPYLHQDRLGIFSGSLMSAVFGYLWLRWVLRPTSTPHA
jgi:NhaA family Na+:H+ antiporter